MKVLIVGSGGREHALAWKVSQSPLVTQVYVAPGNAGTARETGLINVPISAENISGLLAFAQEQGMDLTIIGPEAPLVAGIVDRFQQAGLRCFGPTAAAAQLEGSKAYAKDFLARYGIPTAAYAVFTELAPALTYLQRQPTPIVIKADGLAAGKGVVIAQTCQEAEEAVRSMLGGEFGQAGARVVIEAFLRGEEASFIVICDGQHVIPMASSQDHKARDDGDRGPNTGGMGAYSPAPVVTPEVEQRAMEQVILPTLRGMAVDGHPYVGFLYAGLMVAEDGSLGVLEFNCRFGDPETQPIMLRLQSDLVVLCQAALDGCLDKHVAHWDPRPALGVVMAAGGYPASYRRGDGIHGLDSNFPSDVKVFHAGTSEVGGTVVTNGGRVLCVSALGTTVAEAQRRAYQGVELIHWDGAFCRRDIGYRAIAREAV